MTNQNKRLRFIFIAAICFLVLLSVITYSRLSILIESGKLVNHTSQVTLELERSISSLKDAETGHRGYLLSHDELFLDQFKRGINEYPVHLQNLEGLVNNPRQKKNLLQVEFLADHRKKYMYKMLEVDKVRRPTGNEMIAGKFIMDSLRSEISKMISVEKSFLDEEENLHRRQMFFAPAAIFLLSILAFLILFLSYWQLNKSLRQAQRLKKEMTKQNEQLESRTAELKSQKEFADLIIDTSLDLIGVYDADMRILGYNKACEVLFGIKKEQVLGKVYTDVFPASKNSQSYNDLSRALKGEIIHNASYLSPITNKYFENFIAPLKDSNGNVYAAVAIAHDITERVEAEEKITKVNTELQQQNEFIETVLNSSIDMIMVFDRELRILQANQKAMGLYATFYDGNIIGKKLPEIIPEYPTTDIETVLTKGETIIRNPYKSLLGDIYYEVSFIPLHKENKIYAVMVITHDITDSIKKQDELEKMNKELQSFAYISSHDLQEPLRKIHTFSARIMEIEFNSLSDTAKNYFSRMQDGVTRMQKLIDDLLAYSRTSTEERKFEYTDLAAVIDEVKEELKEDLQQKQATIELISMCHARIIPFQFRQLMLNLIGNSLKFSNADHSPHIQIKSEIGTGSQFNQDALSAQGRYCHITVSDNGIGFDQQYAEKIFEIFQRLHGRKEYNGTGIGLSIVKKIVENHHGIITATGEMNKGARFEIYIPT